MFNPSFLVSTGIAIAVVTASITATAASNNGTDVLHFFDHVAFANDGVISNATGKVDARQNQQGNANNQTLDISVRGLDTNTTYSLQALTGDDTNLAYASSRALLRDGFHANYSPAKSIPPSRITCGVSVMNASRSLSANNASALNPCTLRNC